MRLVWLFSRTSSAPSIKTASQRYFAGFRVESNKEGRHTWLRGPGPKVNLRNFSWAQTKRIMSWTIRSAAILRSTTAIGLGTYSDYWSTSAGAGRWSERSFRVSFRVGWPRSHMAVRPCTGQVNVLVDYVY
jgi:hypothetical protein